MTEDPVHAPECPEDTTWINCDRPQNLADHFDRGNVVILAFWSHSDLTSVNFFDELLSLKQEIGESVKILTMYSPKFDAEDNRKVADHAVNRLDTEFPVGLDFDGEVRRRFGISGTPSLLLMAPDGNVVGTLSGETQYKDLRNAVEMILEEHGLSSEPGTGEPGDPKHEQSLSYPRGIAFDSHSGRFAVADTTGHRVLVFKQNGDHQFSIGGTRGDNDGDFSSAQFCFPHGLEFSEEGLYVCDTGNHRVKGIDFENERVHNLMGDGTRGGTHQYSGQPDQVGLMSPYDLVKVKNSLWITMAGGHQIWRYQILEETFESWLGTGAEGFQDGPHSQVTMAQPTGICSRDDVLYFLDSRTSALRKYDPEEDWVETLIGKGMFQAGDVDGDIDDAMMNFPLGIGATDEHLFITDAFNHKVKKFDPADGELESWLGSGDPGPGVGDSSEFFEPSALACGTDYLYIADSNNNRCLTVDRTSWETAEIH